MLPHQSVGVVKGIRHAHDTGMALRTFLAADGTRWSVWCVERSAFVLRAGAPPAWLVFTNERGTECRRLFEVPPDWESLPSERLDLLRRIAEPAPDRGATPATDAQPAREGERTSEQIPERPAGQPAHRTAGSRTFVDTDGVAWQVWEVRPSLLERRKMRERRAAPRAEGERRRSNRPRPLIAVKEELRDGWLAFRSANEHRRRAPIPEGWTEMDDQELRDLLAGAIRFERAHRQG